MKGNAYTLLYAAILAVVCATALTAVQTMTAEQRRMNEEAEKARNILRVLDISVDKGASADEVLEILRAKGIEEHKRGKLTTYGYDHPSAGRLVAVEFKGPGLWGPVEGLLCLRSDMKRIYGISFYKQEETPGMGGKIGEKPFRDRFRGKNIYGADGQPGVYLVRDKADQINEVDAISGATMTSNKVQDMLNETIRLIAEQEASGG